MVVSVKTLIGTSVLSCLCILVALFTPGWFILYGTDYRTSISVSVFYARLCYYDRECVLFSLETSLKTIEGYPYSRMIVEGLGCLIGTILGGVLTIYLRSSLTTTGQRRGQSIIKGVLGLIFTIIGAISGCCLIAEFIICNHRNILLPEWNVGFPYSLIMCSFGLLLQIICIFLHVCVIKTKHFDISATDVALDPLITQ